MCYLMEERSAESLDIEKEVELMKNLGVRTVRQWDAFHAFHEQSRNAERE